MPKKHIFRNITWERNPSHRPNCARVALSLLCPSWVRGVKVPLDGFAWGGWCTSRAPLDRLEAAAEAQQPPGHRGRRQVWKRDCPQPWEAGTAAGWESCTQGSCRNLLYHSQNSIPPAISWTASCQDCKWWGTRKELLARLIISQPDH